MRKHKAVLWIAIPGALLVIGVMAFAIFEPIQVLPRIRLAPGYSLTDQSAQSITSEDARGDVVLYSFGYAGCGAKCEGTESTVRDVVDRLDEIDMGDVDVRFVTMSYNPGDDNPDVLGREATRAGADGTTWRYATGDPDHVTNVIRSGFKAYYKEKEDGSFSFDPTLILVDGWGVIRGEYKFQTIKSDADKIIRHLGLLGDEIRNSNGASSLAYEAAHFFLCYP